MYIDRVPKRNSPPLPLLRESYRCDGTVKKRTITNLSKWPSDLFKGLDKLLHGGVVVDKLQDCFDVERSLPHAHVATALGTLCKVGLDCIMGGRGSREHALKVAMIVARIIDPRSKLANARGLGEETRFSRLAQTGSM